MNANCLLKLLLPLGMALVGSAHALTLNGTVRDFCAPDVTGNCTRLTDFEGNGTYVVQGMVSTTLGPGGVPTYVGGGSGNTNAANFAKWYTDTPGYNLSMPFSLSLNETAPGSGTFNYSNALFFPIDNLLYGNQGRDHNYHFTVHLEGQTSFLASDSFAFGGDDDLWVYIDNKLVMDIGGTHGAATRVINGADLIALGLAPDTLYDIDIFFAERHTSASYLNLSTILRPQQHILIPEPGSLSLFGATLLGLGVLRRRNRG